MNDVMNEAERINTPGHREVNELDYEFLEAERKVLKVEAERRTNGRTMNDVMNEAERINTPGHREVNELDY